MTDAPVRPDPVLDCDHRRPAGGAHARALLVLAAAFLPLGLFLAALGMFLPRTLAGEVVRVAVSWIPALGVDLSMMFDGLSERFVDDEEANELLTRNYREPFVVPKRV